MQTLDSIVKNYIAQSGRSINKYLPYLNYAITAVKELHYDVDGVVKVEQLELLDTNVAYVPKDSIKIGRVYMSGSNGFIQEIFEEGSLNPRGTDDCGDDTRIGGIAAGHSDIYQTAESVTEHVRDGEFIGREYGAGGGGIYSYRYNRERGRLEFSGNVTNPVFIEYLGSKERIDGKFMVNEMAQEAILNGIRYYELRFRNRVGASEKAEAERRWFASKRHYKIREYNRGIGEMTNAKRKTMKQSPKY